MEYLSFSFWFVVVHVASYIFAGVIALKISKDIYEGRERLLDFLRDMSNPVERKHVEKTFLPIQVLRALLLSIVLYPAIGPLGQDIISC